MHSQCLTLTAYLFSQEQGKKKQIFSSPQVPCPYYTCYQEGTIATSTAHPFAQRSLKAHRRKALRNQPCPTADTRDKPASKSATPCLSPPRDARQKLGLKVRHYRRRKPRQVESALYFSREIESMVKAKGCPGLPVLRS